MATGFESKAIGNYSQALGYTARARGNNSTAIGNNANAVGDESYAFGNFAETFNQGSYAIGSGASASGLRSFAVGSTGIDSAGVATSPTIATADYAYAFGMGSTASAQGAFSMGTQNIASGDYSLAMGYNTEASYWYSTSMGYKTTASSTASTAMGYNSNASGVSSTAMGYSSNASGHYSTAIGFQAEANDDYSVAIGRWSTASAHCATAIGYYTLANGAYSMAMGSTTIASGSASTAMGSTTTASGFFSTSMGTHSTAQAYASVAVGRYNLISGSSSSWVDTDPLFVVGNGSSTSTRSNALTVLKNGNVGIGISTPTSTLTISGSAEIGGLNPTATNGNATLYLHHYNNIAHQLRYSSGTLYLEAAGNGYGTNTTPNFVVGGSLGVGITSFDSKFQVSGAGTNGIGIYGDVTAGSDGVVAIWGQANGSGSQAAKGIVSKVNRGGTGTYHSGYFYSGGTGGSYGGLYADIRSGGAIDIAEYILDTENNTEPGDVVIADPNNKESILKSGIPFDDKAVGIISTTPHLIMGTELIMDKETGERYENVHAAQLALAGRVPVKVTDENGSIEIGDFITTSSKSGHGMKWSSLDVTQAQDFEELKTMLAENERRRGAIIGKALEAHEAGDGKIVVLISLQ